ncbi:histone-lysine N-methyltransferase SETDB2 isoform X1 [Fundulus heteroclitus]|uniref:histone-lysine N-methyltransferase SETDB2 isoform X1 n=1 Tax=Fundulus heteroclitus TaxID=8078 RepID=UPI00165C3DDA|nr:histone-lysine N-methyltransferase SETDB2 isoform X1 [Fundulus heteroclitus]
MGDVLDPRDVERAKAFWAEKDVDQVFSRVFQCLGHLKQVLLKRTATDKEYVRAQKLLECLDCPPSGLPDLSVVQVVIGSGGLLPAAPVQLFNGGPPPAGREELLPPLAPAQLQYHPHPCCKSCLPISPRTPESRSLLHGQNPLKVPLLCGFKRLTTMPLLIRFRQDEDVPEDGWDVIYKAPCGQSLRSFEDVACFLTATESYDILQVDFFTFNHLVQLDPAPSAASPTPQRRDLSRGAEPTPVELCMGDDESRPADFRYRKDRWPHGCFLTRGPTLFLACCDCTDGCGAGCACAAMTAGGQGYRHQRLPEPVQSGLYECGPWCGCDRARCQNRLVQRGLRVRLQVYQTEDRGWGVRCRDDLDRGTFICTYAGVVLQRDRSPEAPPAAKQARAEPPSDDEVEVVTEWPATPVLDTLALPGSPRATQHVPVIQKPGESGAAPQDPDQVQTAPLTDSRPTSPSAGGLSEVRVTVAMEAQDGGRSLKRAAAGDDVCVIDASWEGNVGRFINHSCQPNLFIQNVFTDCHDPAFPVIAFFTSRVIKAGTELTWNYAADGAAENQEVACLCRSNGCRGWLHLEENLCDVCEADAAEN